MTTVVENTPSSQAKSLKVLALIWDVRLPDNTRLYTKLAELIDLDIVLLDKRGRRNIPKVLKKLDLSKYDRIVMELRFKHALPYIKYLKTVPNLMLYDDDAWQNFATFGKNQNKFIDYYQQLQPKRIINSGACVAEKVRQHGFDSEYLGKGFDGTRLNNLNLVRDIDMGFIGRFEHTNYTPRRDLLLALKERSNLQLLRTETDAEYLETLNRIRFFISADVEFGEYMIKNFEAMACGCVLIAYAQGEEDEKLGLKSMQNCVLYTDVDDLMDKYNALVSDPALIEAIGKQGQAFAEAHHEYGVLAKKYATILLKPFD